MGFPRTSFLDLPAEIRMRIYHLLFGSGQAQIHADLNIHSENSAVILRPNWIEPQNRSAQLLRVNKQIQAEATEFFFDRTTFVVNRYANPFALQYVNNGPDSFGGHMRHLKIHVAVQDFPNMLKRYVDGLKYLESLRTFKIICISGAWLMQQPWYNLSLGDEDVKGYKDIHATVQKAMWRIWFDAEFTHFDDESVENRKIAFTMIREPGFKAKVSEITSIPY